MQQEADLRAEMEDARLRGVKEGKAKDSSHDSQMSALKKDHAQSVEKYENERAKLEGELKVHQRY